jgi:hypothetical protein
MQVGSTATLLLWRGEELYCRAVDRLVGGKRFGRFVERCERRLQKNKKDFQKAKETEEIAETRFDLRLLQNFQAIPFRGNEPPTKTI